MNSSPTAMRMIDERMSSDPISGPTVVRLRGRPPSASPKRSTSARSTSAQAVLLAIGAGDPDAPGVGEAVGEGEAAGVPDPLGAGVGDPAPLADGTVEALGTGVCGGSRPIGSVRISR